MVALRSGARLRRADSLQAAYRHLGTYRPSLVIADLGLPDGSGLDLIRDLAAHRPNCPVVLATSGDEEAALSDAALAAGADGYIPKPVESLRDFQNRVLVHFPDRQREGGKIVQLGPRIRPDDLSLAEDLDRIRALIAQPGQVGVKGALAYGAQFLASLAEASGDRGLSALSADLAGALAVGDPTGRSQTLDRVARDLARRVAPVAAI